MKIGIIGNGFVGNSIAFGFSPTHEIRIHDKDPKRNLNTMEEVLECDFIFVAVPTPMNRDGSISLKVVEKALQEISEKNTKNNKEPDWRPVGALAYDQTEVSWRFIEAYINNAGATYDRGPVVIDKNIVSCPHYDFMGEWMRTGYSVWENRGK